MGIFSDKSNTFKPKKNHGKSTKRHELHKYAKNTLGSGNLKQAVALPPKEDINEWFAVNSKQHAGPKNAAFNLLSLSFFFLSKREMIFFSQNSSTSSRLVFFPLLSFSKPKQPSNRSQLTFTSFLIKKNGSCRFF